MSLLIPISWGELFDKISILEIKSERIKDFVKLNNINKELQQLTTAANQKHASHPDLMPLLIELKNVNQKLWDIEDQIRVHESEKKFNDKFIELARSVYITNDARALLKHKINNVLKSDYKEEKSYKSY